MTFADIIDIADKAYGEEGLVAAYHRCPKKNFGDTLAKFIAVEIKDVSGKEPDDEHALNFAAGAIESAVGQLERVATALRDAADDAGIERERNSAHLPDRENTRWPLRTTKGRAE